MREHAIIFSGHSVRGILANEKTETRRLMPQVRDVETGKPVLDMRISWVGWPCAADPGPRHPERQCSAPGPNEVHVHHYNGFNWSNRPLRYAVGDHLWVRERFSRHLQGDGVWYWADGDEADQDSGQPVSPIFMPRALSRITLEVTAIRAERLQDITDAGAIAEGVREFDDYQERLELIAVTGVGGTAGLSRDCYAAAWDRLNRHHTPWASDPWVEVIIFRRLPARGGS